MRLAEGHGWKFGNGWARLLLKGRTLNLRGGNLQWQVSVEADLFYLDVSGSETSSIASDNHVVSDDGYLGTLRARLGFAADRLLIYGTGGLAAGDTGSKWVDDGGASQFVLSADSQWGWVAGGGIEYAATDSFSVKAEYLYYDLGTDKLHYSGGPPAWCTPFGEGCDFELKNTGSIIRLGVNFHF